MLGKDPLEMSWGDDDAPTQTPAPEPRVLRKTPRYHTAIVLLLAVALTLFLGYSWGRIPAERAARDAQQAEQAAKESAVYWMREAHDTSATVDWLRSELTSATAAAEMWRQRSEEASQTIESLRPPAPSKSSAKPAAGTAPVRTHYDTSGVEQWRSLVAAYFPPENVDAALSVMQKESSGIPTAQNPSGASGLFQQMPEYWAERLAAAEIIFGKDFNDSIFDPEANIAASAVLSNGGRDWSHWSVKP